MTTLPLSIMRWRSSQRGSALIMVFWLIAMLTMVIYSMHAIVAHDVELTISQSLAFRARQLAEDGLNIAMNPTVKKYDKDLLEQMGDKGNTIIPMAPEESVVVKIRGEGGRININALIQNDAPHRALATNFFHFWGLTNDQADALFDCMVDWTDTDDERLGSHGMERKDYLDLFQTDTTPYPFNHPFYNLDEVLLVPGFDQIAANLRDWRDYFTIYSTGKLDVNEAEPKVLAAAAICCRQHMSTDPEGDFARELDNAQKLMVDDKYGQDGKEDTQDDTQLDPNVVFQALSIPAPGQGGDGMDLTGLLFGGPDQTVHIESTATVGDYRKRVVLVVRNRTGNPQILAREEVPIFSNK